MQIDLPTCCPLCDGPVHVERVRCETCESAIEGRFGLDWLMLLKPEQLKFVKVFLVCRGKIKDVEQALGLSYPTVVARLDDVVGALGAQGRARLEAAAPPALPEPAPPPPKTERRLEVLKALSDGAIDIDEAERRLRER
jgi:hypothetical protein